MKRLLNWFKTRGLRRTFRDDQRYRFLQPVGQGGLSTVGSFLDTRLNRVVAVKSLNAQHVDEKETLRLFVNETKLLGYLDHPGVMPVYDAFLLESGRPCYSMKLCEGKTLKELLAAPAGAEAVALPLRRALEILLKLCQTMAYVHDKGVLHLDLKPDNIVVGTYGEVMVLDWGSAHLFKSREFYKNLERFTDQAGLARFETESEGTTVITPAYMSPEQGEVGRDKLTPASEVFSAGIIFYEMLTGHHPFVGGTVKELVERIRSQPAAPPHELNPAVPRMLSQICMRMLEKSAARRYAGFHAVLQDLAAYNGFGEEFPLRVCEPGEILFREGDPGDFAFTVLSGQVEIIKQMGAESRVIGVAGVGEVLGELAILGRQPRTATARALGPTRIRILAKADIDRELEKLSPWVSQMITGLSGRFLELRGRLLELEGRPGSPPGQSRS